jgi:hypothetical protein
MEKNSIFLQELGSNSPGFLELESQKKGTQKGMHSLVYDGSVCIIAIDAAFFSFLCALISGELV